MFNFTGEQSVCMYAYTALYEAFTQHQILLEIQGSVTHNSTFNGNFFSVVLNWHAPTKAGVGPVIFRWVTQCSLLVTGKSSPRNIEPATVCSSNIECIVTINYFEMWPGKWSLKLLKIRNCSSSFILSFFFLWNSIVDFFRNQTDEMAGCTYWVMKFTHKEWHYWLT